MLLPGAYPPDIRVRKEASALIEGGHDLTLICRGDGPARETIENVEVRRIPGLAPFASPRGAVDGVWYSLTHVNRAWERTLDSFIDRRAIDAFHVHDLPLVKTALRVGTRNGVSVVADLHENYPEAMRQWQQTGDYDPKTLAKRLFLPPRRLKRLERWCVRRADQVITVCEEARAHYLRDCGADPRRVAVVSNTVDRDAFDVDSPHDPELGFDPGEFVVSYIGSFGSHRGLETLIEGVAATDARLALVGGGTDEYARRVETRAHERLGDRVRTTGWVPFADVSSYMAASDVCVVPHQKTGHTNTTIPHKLFQAMAMEIPVIVTDVPPLRRIVDGERCGIVVPAGDSTAMAEAIRELAANPERAHELGANGRQAVERRYNWERDGARLRAVHRELQTESGIERQTET